MPRTFNCPKCGAPLDSFGDGGHSVECPFCGNTVIVPAEMRGAPPPLGATGAAEERPRGEPGSPPQPAAASQPATLAGETFSAALLANLARIKELVQAGRLEEAITLYREVFDVNRTRAEEAIRRHAAGEPLVVSQRITVSLHTPQSQLAFPSSRLTQVLEALKAGERERAAELYQELFDIAPPEARAAIEQLLAGEQLPQVKVIEYDQWGEARRQAGPARARGGGSCLAWLIGALIAAFVLAMVGGLPFRLSGAYQRALQAANADANLTEALGAPIEPSWWLIGGRMGCGGGGCSARFSVPVHGPNGRGTLDVSGSTSGGLFLNPDEWNVSAVLRVNDGPDLPLGAQFSPAAINTPETEVTRQARATEVAATEAAQAVALALTRAAVETPAAATQQAVASATAEARATVEAAATQRAVVAAAAAWPVAVSDTFDSNDAGWPVGPTRDNSLSVESAVRQGAYAWTVNVGRGNSYFNLIPADALEFDSFYAAVDVKWVKGGSGSYAYGLVFRHVNDDYGFFGLQTDGTYRVLTVFGTGIYQSILSSSEHIRTGDGAVNRIAVYGLGSDFVCEINGQVVEIIHEDFIPGQIGLGIDALFKGAEEQVEFDNFVVQAPR